MSGPETGDPGLSKAGTLVGVGICIVLVSFMLVGTAGDTSPKDRIDVRSELVGGQQFETLSENGSETLEPVVSGDRDSVSLPRAAFGRTFPELPPLDDLRDSDIYYVVYEGRFYLLTVEVTVDRTRPTRTEPDAVNGTGPETRSPDVTGSTGTRSPDVTGTTGTTDATSAPAGTGSADTGTASTAAPTGTEPGSTARTDTGTVNGSAVTSDATAASAPDTSVATNATPTDAATASPTGTPTVAVERSVTLTVTDNTEQVLVAYEGLSADDRETIREAKSAAGPINVTTAPTFEVDGETGTSLFGTQRLYYLSWDGEYYTVLTYEPTEFVETPAPGEILGVVGIVVGVVVLLVGAALNARS